MTLMPDNNIQEIASGAVDWPAIINQLINNYEAGRTIKKTAGETLVKGDPFYIKAADGKAWKATNATKRIGIWQSTSTIANAEGFGQVDGTMTLGTWAWTIDTLIYVNSSGALTATATGNGAPIAYSLTTTKILIFPQPYPINLPNSLGAADQVPGMNAGGTAFEYKTIQGTVDEVDVTHGVGTITIGIPNPTGKTIKVVAGELLVKGDPFYIAADEKAYKATNTTECRGLWQSLSTALGAEGYGQYDGTMEITDSSSWSFTPNLLICPTASGTLTTDSSTNSGKPIAISLTATKVMIIPQLGLIPQPYVAGASISHTITDPTDSPIDADALREDLVTNTIPSIESALNALGEKQNEIIALLKALKFMSIT